MKSIIAIGEEEAQYFCEAEDWDEYVKPGKKLVTEMAMRETRSTRERSITYSVAACAGKKDCDDAILKSLDNAASYEGLLANLGFFHSVVCLVVYFERILKVIICR